MAAWGHRNFENDDALDFVWSVTEGGVPAILNAINNVSNKPESENLDTADCTQALAAMEYIAAAKGKPSEDFPEESETWLERNGGKELLSVDSGMVLKAIRKIKNNSKLRGTWDEGAGAGEWLTVLSSLEQRLS
jgi:hypothetical protein